MEVENFKFSWVSCDGGPLLLIEEKYLKFWEGSEAPSNGRIVEADFRWGLDIATDYDKACDVEDWLALIEVGEGKALVLGGEPNPTTWLYLEEDEGMLVRWIYADSEYDAIESAKLVPNNFGKEEDFEFVVENTNLILFAACESWDDNIYPRLSIALQKGAYRIYTKEYKDEQTWILCQHFRKSEI